MITYLQVMRMPSRGREVTAVVAVCRFDVNMSFKQCMIAIDSYAATNT